MQVHTYIQNPLKSQRQIVVFTSNPLDHEGGVVAFYNLLVKSFSDSFYKLHHHPVGSRMQFFEAPVLKRLLYPLYFFYDTLKLIHFFLRSPDARILHVNPSLIPVPLIRDGLLIIIAKVMGRKVIVLFHGWKDWIARSLLNNRWLRVLFHFIYDRASTIIVLAERFKGDLISLGFSEKKIHITSTMYEAADVVPFSDRNRKRLKFLYLGRISPLKGIAELINAAKILRERGCDFELTVVGHGDREGIVEKYRDLSQQYDLGDLINFTGRLTGRDKYQAFADSDVYVFPSWTEGCPTSVLEALGSGLFVISTDVGALREIIRDGENGKIIRLKDFNDLADKMVWACENIDIIRNKRAAIQAEAITRYETSVVAEQFRKIYHQLDDEN